VVFDGTIEVVTIDGVGRTATQAWAASGHECDFTTEPVAAVIRGVVSKGNALVWHFGVPDAQTVCVIYGDGGKIICSVPAPAPKHLNCLAVSRGVTRSQAPPSVEMGEAEPNWTWLYDQFGATGG
jgi:hypothetical protein